MKNPGALTLSVGAAAILIGDALPAHAQIAFTNVADVAGLDQESYTSSNNHALGVIWIDFNEDGWPDLFATNGYNNSNHLYQNNGDGTFTLVDNYLPPLPNYEYMGAVFGDYDNDGDSDIYLFTDHEILLQALPENPTDGPPNILLQNQWIENGGAVSEPLFLDVTAAAGVEDLADDPPVEGYQGNRAPTGSFLDYDRDGHLDLYIGHWGTGHEGEPTLGDRLYRNLGDGTFEDVTEAAGIRAGPEPEDFRSALAVIGGHLDQNFWPDIYVGNVKFVPPAAMDYIYRNGADGTFTDVIAESPGVGDDSNAAMGITLGDIDLDGDWDVYISDLGSGVPPQGNPLYLNNGDGTFADNSADLAGVTGANSWGVNFIDADHDGYEDLYVGTMGSGGDDLFYRNLKNGTFQDISATSGIAFGGSNRGSALADYDADGDLDLACTYQNGVLRLFRNDTNNAGHWIQIRLEARHSNADAIGTLVRLETAKRQLQRQVLGGTSSHSQDQLPVHFGLYTDTTAETIDIQWPSGIWDMLTNVAGDRLITVYECVPDIDGTGVVNTDDLLLVLGAWGTSPEGPPDINYDGTVNIFDLLDLIAYWGPCL